ncbi:hypothetical protein ABKN59_012067 [Abortiporus biennis]
MIHGRTAPYDRSSNETAQGSHLRRNITIRYTLGSTNSSNSVYSHETNSRPAIQFCIGLTTVLSAKWDDGYVLE